MTPRPYGERYASVPVDEWTEDELAEDRRQATEMLDLLSLDPLAVLEYAWAWDDGGGAEHDRGYAFGRALEYVGRSLESLRP